MDLQVRRFVIETKQRSDPQVSINGMNIEGRDGNPMSVRNPGTFAGTAPAAAWDVPEIVLDRNCAREFNRPIKPDAHSRPTDEREQSRTHLAMHVDHEIVFRTPDLFEQKEEAEHGAPFLAGLREIATR